MVHNESSTLSLLLMKRGQKVKLFLLLLCITITSFILTCILNTIHKEEISSIVVDSRLGQSSANLRTNNRCHEEKHETSSIYYHLSGTELYHYEFRYELRTPRKNDDFRLMIILYGAKRACNDMWNFSVGDRILSALRHSDYSILAICSKRKTYDIHLPLTNNNDVKYIYLSLQTWMNTIYYPQFHRYPLLYIHGTSRGSHLAGLLCRILPVQAQILNTYPGHRESMLIHSQYDSDMQTRLLLDPTFSNWFYFYFCYQESIRNATSQNICPFQSDKNYFYPIPPTFFTFLKNDPYQDVEIYKKIIMDIQHNARHLGGTLIAHQKALQLDILSPAKMSPSYMQENFHIWCSKPHSSQLFFEHYTNPSLYEDENLERQTCWCSKIDFKYFELRPNITKTWSIKKQQEYSDYTRDIRIFKNEFCEEVCGDLMTTHSMVSRNIHKMLVWINEMNLLRRTFYLDDYRKRPLRIWMYDKDLLIINSTYFVSKKVNWNNISKEYQMYSPEYYLQIYFQNLNQSRKINDHYFQWATNPLLADYFIIPSDLMYFYFSHQPSTMNDQQFQELHLKLNKYYIEILLKNIQTMFPYWRLTPEIDQIGSNHVIIIPGGRNMGLLYNKTQYILRNVIQLGFTGIRTDLLPINALPQYTYRNIHITYRHRYDVIIPQSTRFKRRRVQRKDLDVLIKKKKRLFYFAGALNHITSSLSARSLLASLKQDIEQKESDKMRIEIENKQFDIIKIINGHIKSHEYIESIQSSIFVLCPEGYLPWSPRIYESIQLGAIPMLLVDNIVLPFERFIDWRSFTVKINISNIKNILNFVDRIEKFEEYVQQKLKNSLPYLYAFHWPYSIDDNGQFDKHMFAIPDDFNVASENVFHYISLELRCRRLEQWYGYTVAHSNQKSFVAQQLTCTQHPTICPCHNEEQILAFQEYI